MSGQESFTFSQKLTVLSSRSGHAYIIPCDEWCFIKDKIGRAFTEPWLFRTIGPAFIGASLSTVIAIFLGTFAAPEKESAKLIAWGVFSTTFLAGLLCLYFTYEVRKSKKTYAKDILDQMGLIEQRHDPTSSSELKKEETKEPN